MDVFDCEHGIFTREIDGHRVIVFLIIALDIGNHAVLISRDEHNEVSTLSTGKLLEEDIQRGSFVERGNLVTH